ncbi:basal-body rod modification protein FlgD [Gluconobacter morbifer G707]|uniref:Basal-body rod modification protein FlgD n=1 Tax=Gluconobacter morbifer G707 TaxID=1088869 RepID=G6XLQ9_9PROT|nr:basal-body rod modification protein FlgD [Gluconobacter morbifer G707]
MDNSGKQLADGSYSVAIEGTSTDGTNVSISPVVSGTVTGFTRSASGVQAKMGDTSIDLDDLSGFSST